MAKKSFHSHLMNMSEYFNLPDLNPDLLDIAMVKRYVSSVKQECISYLIGQTPFNILKNVYRSFKTDRTTSNHLDLTLGTAGRRALVKLRISNHKLMIEFGRYNQTTKDNSHCLFCGFSLIEDDVQIQTVSLQNVFQSRFPLGTFSIIVIEFLSNKDGDGYENVTYSGFPRKYYTRQ